MRTTMTYRAAALHALLLTACSAATLEVERTAIPRTEALASSTASFGSGFYVPIDELTLLSTDDAQGVANGNVVVSFDTAAFEPTLDANGEVERVRSQLALRGALTLELRVDVAGKLSGRRTLLPMTPLAVIPITDTVSVTPFVYASMDYEVLAAASGSASVIVPFEASADFTKRSNDSEVHLHERRAQRPRVGAPDVAASIDFDADFEVGVVFMITVDGLSLGGPTLAQLTGLDLHVTALPAPAWNAELTLALRGGWSITPEFPVFSHNLAEVVVPVPGASLPGGLTPTRWSRVYDSQENEHAGAFVQTDDGVVLLAEAGGWPWLSQIDASGEFAWQRAAATNDGALFYPSALNRMPEGDFVASGWQSDRVQGMRIERYDAAGNPRWVHIMRATVSDTAGWNASTPSAAGGTILAGSISHPTVRNCVLAEVDKNGQLVWQTELDLGVGTINGVLQAVALTASGEILAVGSVTYEDETLAGANGLVVRLDAAGNALHAFAVGGLLSDNLMTLAVHPDGSYAVGGSSWLQGEQSSWIAAFTAQDVLRWSGLYSGDSTDPYARVYSLAPREQHGLLVAAGIGSPNSTQAYLFELDRAGMPVWFKSYDSPTADVLTDVMGTDDGSILAFGHTQAVNDVLPTAKHDLWVLSTSIDGMVNFAADSGMDAKNETARWRPAADAVHTLQPSRLPPTLEMHDTRRTMIDGSASSELISQ
jgi:hypothetical protein